MKVRAGVEADIPAIVSLLKLSLGESLMPKSIAYWRWKHIDNPFGPSPVLVAEENGEIVGIRAFMRWQWTDGMGNYSAVRAVDTATHPAHQGKGIFKKLTLQLADECKQQGVDFIFNTPNQQSRPGYLKMGWQDTGRVPVKIKPINIIGMMESVVTKKVKRSPQNSSGLLEDELLEQLLIEDQKYRKKIHTQYTIAYLKWRYVHVPVVKYVFFNYIKEGIRTLIIGRIKASRFGNEFRITDMLSNTPTVTRDCKAALFLYAKKLGADYITCVGNDQRISFGFSINSGPNTTIRILNNISQSALLKFASWSPAFGDLELF